MRLVSPSLGPRSSAKAAGGAAEVRVLQGTASSLGFSFIARLAGPLRYKSTFHPRPALGVSPRPELALAQAKGFSGLGLSCLRV